MRELDGHFQPWLTAQVSHGQRVAPNVAFLVDTGAAVSIIQMFVGWTLLGDDYRSKLPQRPIPGNLQDVSGQPLRGCPLDVVLTVPDLGEIEETIWVAEGVRYNLLGCSRWFEEVGAKFENFPNASTGRRFGLHHRYRG